MKVSANRFRFFNQQPVCTRQVKSLKSKISNQPSWEGTLLGPACMDGGVRVGSRLHIQNRKSFSHHKGRWVCKGFPQCKVFAGKLGRLHRETPLYSESSLSA